MTAFVPYVTFMKHAKKVAKGKATKSRPILSTVYHSDKYVAVTDSHRLYVATGLYEGGEKTLDAQTGQEVDHGNYPDVERLTADPSSAKYSQEVDVNAAYDAVRAIEIIGRALGEPYLEAGFGDNVMTLRNFYTDGIGATFTAGDGLNTDASVRLDIKYVKEALHVLKDVKVEKCTINYYGDTRPIEIISGNFTAVIMLVRTTK